MSVATHSEVGCCLSCGRDTHGAREFCRHCIIGEPPMLGHKALPPRPGILEDDYSEDSDANSVCEDEGVNHD